ncbi:hypothetical protein GW17_00031752 [Ensete ventricosum]|nr:hypothetical protein GW17_00031752 [Ensete ventricosum]
MLSVKVPHSTSFLDPRMFRHGRTRRLAAVPPRVEVLAQGPDAVLGDLHGRRAHERLPSTRRLRSLARHAIESWRTLMSTGEGESGGT